MAENEMFKSVARSANDLAGVFEYDGEVGCFYLYDVQGNNDQKVIGAIRVLTEAPNFEEEDIEIYWDVTEEMAGLSIRGQIWAVFDTISGTKYGGNYRIGAQAEIS